MDDHHHSSSGEISCSICLDLVHDSGVRSRAKLKCGHEFHLDCIGSAFNMKGEMQCPNCQEVEIGQWLYVNGPTRSVPEFSVEDWVPDEDIYDMGYADAELPFRFHWCPFGEATQMHSSFEEVESPSIPYHQPNAMVAEQVAAPSVPQSYVVHLRSIPHASSRSIDITDDPSFNNSWNSFRGQNDILNPHPFPAISIQYQRWGRHSSPYGPSNSLRNTLNPSATLRNTRLESSALLRSRARMLWLVPGSDRRGESSLLSSFDPPPEPIARAHTRVQVFHDHDHHHHRQHHHHHHHHPHQHHQQHSMPSPAVPTSRRFDSNRSLPATVAAPPPHDHNTGFYIVPPSSSSDRSAPEAERHFHICGRAREPHYPIAFAERDSSWGPSQHSFGGQDSSGNQSSSLRNGPWSA